VPIARNSFIQMSKLTNLKGRINYISSHIRQENLYAVYETTDRKFWRELAKCNQEDFSKSETKGKCIEARELIIALPESFVEYQPDMLLKVFTKHFKQKYGVECISALHHNKRKTNYHIHLLFSERRLLDEPIEKVATRNMFYDENGKHVRTKKEITGENGQLRVGCKIIQKGEVYERKIFGVKDTQFKSEEFLEEVKHSYTELINIYVKDSKEQLQVFDKNGAHLPMKKIGKKNPKTEQMVADNEMRKKWNQTVDRAFLSGIPEKQVLQVKNTEISRKTKESFEQFGSQPQLFATIILMAIAILERMITKIINLVYQNLNKEKVQRKKLVVMEQQNLVTQQSDSTVSERTRVESAERMPIPEKPRMTPLAKKYVSLSEINEKLKTQNTAIFQREQQLNRVEQELAGTKGIFKGRQRKELQEQIDGLKRQIDSMKQYFSSIVRNHGYKNIKEFLTEYSTAKAEYADYQRAFDDWKKKYATRRETDIISERQEFYREQEKELDNGTQRIDNHSRVRGRRAR
jgi:hypothetical protein